MCYQSVNIVTSLAMLKAMYGLVKIGTSEV